MSIQRYDVSNAVLKCVDHGPDGWTRVAYLILYRAVLLRGEATAYQVYEAAGPDEASAQERLAKWFEGPTPKRLVEDALVSVPLVELPGRVVAASST